MRSDDKVKALAIKSMEVVVAYVLLFFLALLLMVMMEALNLAPEFFRIYCLAVIAVDCVLAYRFFKQPNVLVACNDRGELLLPRGVVIPIGEVRNVCSRRDTRRSGLYTYGTLIIDTEQGEYTVKNVSDVENAGREILDVVYKEKYKTERIS